MSELKPCGTQAAYQRHLYWNETPCEPCIQANREYYNSRARRPVDRDKRKQYRDNYRRAHPNRHKKDQDRYYTQGSDRNRYQEWTTHELVAIQQKLLPDKELSFRFGRSIRAIQVMRSKLKKEFGNAK